MIVGKTEDEKTVVDGKFVFKMSDTHGLPLEITVDLLRQKNMVVDWVSFYNAASDVGWQPKRIFSRIEAAVGDVFGSRARQEVSTRLMFCLLRDTHGKEASSHLV